MKLLTVLVLTGLLTGCVGGQRPFLQVQLCLDDAADAARFIDLMQSVSESHRMRYVDRSALTQKELIQLKKAPGYQVVDVGAWDEQGVGWGAGNVGLSAYEMSIGFSEGTSPSSAHAFAEEVIQRMSSKWKVYTVPSNRGALPRCRRRN
jgi:hypothetical protein